MSQPCRAVLFDLDGTLLDTAPDFSRLINEMRTRRNLPPFPYEDLRSVVSSGAAGMIQTAFADITDAEQQLTLKNEFLESYLASPFKDSTPFPGIVDLLSWLEQKQLPWGIVTNKPWRFAEPILQQLGWLKPQVPVYCPEHVTLSKPDPEGLLRAAADLEQQPANCLYAGDHLRDTDAGRNAGMRTIACLYGYVDQSSSTDWPADFHIDNSLQLKPLIESLVS